MPSPSLSDPSSNATRWRGHIPALDGVRGLAVLVVIAGHVIPQVDAGGLIDRALIRAGEAGWVGVDLFFVLSGFLITGILVDARGSAGFFRKFYARRTLRIFPLYYAILVGAFIIGPLVSDSIATNFPAREHQWWFWTYTSNILLAISHTWNSTSGLGHFWSLAVEEQFYLLWPAVVFLFAPRRLMQICVAIVVAAFVLRTSMRLAGAHDLPVFTLMPTRADALAAGAWLALAIRTDGYSTSLRRSAWVVLALAAAGCVVVFAIEHSFPEWKFSVQTFGYSFLALGFGAVVCLSLDAPDRAAPFGRFFRMDALRFLGKYSYAMYCLHPIIQEGLRQMGVTATGIPGLSPGFRMTVVLYAAIVLSCTIIASLITWNLLEKHFLRLKDRFASETPLSVPAP